MKALHPDTQASLVSAWQRILQARHGDLGIVAVEVIEGDGPRNEATAPGLRQIQAGVVTAEQDTNAIGEVRRAA
jgi:hypothetical protein